MHGQFARDTEDKDMNNTWTISHTVSDNNNNIDNNNIDNNNSDNNNSEIL